MAILDRMRKMWNAFRSNEQEVFTTNYDLGPSSSLRPDRGRLRYSNERSLISSIYTRIGIDVAGLGIRHVKVDDDNRYQDDMFSTLNNCLMFEPNMDQSPRAFRQDIAMTLFDKGVAAVVPVDTFIAVDTVAKIDILSLRVGEILNWYPKHVRVNLYNEATGVRQELLLEKKQVAIIENPLYSVMNEPNSTLQRLIRKLNLLDFSDEQIGSGKLDLIIQLPYVIKSEARRQQAEARRQDIEFQLKGSQYGIAYTDGTEKITQLNRPAENNLLKQIEYLTGLLYGQLGITDAIMNGTADEKTMLNYFNRTIEPILDAIVEAMQRAFLGILGTQNNERIRYFRDPFKLVPVTEIAEIADKFTRNEILTANEIRGFMGIPPSSDPKADQLINSNMPQPEEVSED
ncbi:MAG: phage portal protein [Paenisporosarcina sp.]